MAGASPATTMIRLAKAAHSYHGSGTPCGCHVSLLHSYSKDINYYFTSDGDQGYGRFMMKVYISYDKLSTFLRITGKITAHLHIK